MTPASVELCPSHPAAPSVAICIRCGRFLCAECQVSADPPLCAACLPLWTDPHGILSAPFGIGAALRGGMRMFMPVLRPVLLLTLVFSIPGGLLSAASASGTNLMTQFRVTNIYDGLIGLICSVACVALFISVAEARPLGTWQAVLESTSRWGRVFGANFRTGLWVGLFTLALVLPGIWKLVMLALTTAAATRIRRDDPLEVSSSLVQGRWWAVCGALVTTWLIAHAPAVVFSVLMGLLMTMANIAPASAAGVALEVLDNWIGRLSEQLDGAFNLAIFYALARTTGFTLDPLRWRKDG